jgi:peptidoglycan/xylan/chitin deacetylase (PgdA/CDA1 family)/folate-dependent phosphoribosylglycinamide formyltransferase PurN
VGEFRVVVFSSGPARQIGRLIARIGQVAPEARVCGVVSEVGQPKALRQRASRFLGQLPDPEFVRYAFGRAKGALASGLRGLGSTLIDLAHAYRPPADTEPDLPSVCQGRGCSLLISHDFHADETLEFVRSLKPDLGVVYGTRILKPALFAIPRLGSINVHKRKVPDYRGGGPVGLWELLDGRSELGVTVHEVTEKVDAGAVVNAASIPIGPFDTLASLALKAHVVGDDLLARSVAELAIGGARLVPQPQGGRTFKNPSAQRLAQHRRELRARRPRWRAPRSRPAYKLLARTILGLPLSVARNWMASLRGAHPVTILFHHLVTDRPHPLGIPTEAFHAQVRYLKRHYRIVSLRDAIEMLRRGRVTAPTVVLTFDDGYAENHVNLRAVAADLGVPVTMFVSTAHMASRAEFAHERALGCSGFEPLSWEQVAELARAGFEFGSHTRTHFDCGSRNEAALRDEIVGSKQDLEARLGRSVEYFSFPFGLRENISAEALALARESYPYVFSAAGGRNFAGDADLGHLKRCCHVYDLWELELQLQSLLERMEPTSGPTLVAAPART